MSIFRESGAYEAIGAATEEIESEQPVNPKG
jgi:hypothetical protein